MNTSINVQELVKIGNANPWIKYANDPEFDQGSFYEASTFGKLCLFLGGVSPEYLRTTTVEKIRDWYGYQFNSAGSNWCLGSAVIYKNYAFINQVNGGDEWLTIRYNPATGKYVPFESITFKSYSVKTMKEACLRLKSCMARWDKATDEQLRKLEF